MPFLCKFLCNAHTTQLAHKRPNCTETIITRQPKRNLISVKILRQISATEVALQD
jgi:hypothetical protein